MLVLSSFRAFVMPHASSGVCRRRSSWREFPWRDVHRSTKRRRWEMKLAGSSSVGGWSRRNPTRLDLLIPGRVPKTPPTLHLNHAQSFPPAAAAEFTRIPSTIRPGTSKPVATRRFRAYISCCGIPPGGVESLIPGRTRKHAKAGLPFQAYGSAFPRLIVATATSCQAGGPVVGTG